MSKNKSKKEKQPESLLTDKDREIYNEYRLYGTREFDKLIVYISGGALALTATYFYQVREENINVLLIIISWVALSSTLIINLISHLISIAAVDAVLDAQIVEDFEKANKLNAKTDWINIISIFLIALGIGFFFWFAYTTM